MDSTTFRAWLSHAAAAFTIILLMLVAPSQARGGTVTYVYTDPQNSPLAEANAAGEIIRTFDYKPYGKQAVGTSLQGPGYTGHIYDPDSSLVYMQARYYDPEIGRFLSTDPVEPKPGDLLHFGTYLYASDNPLRYVDPDGKLDYEAMIRQQRVPVHIDDTLPQKAQENLKSKLDAGIAKINSTKTLTNKETAIISNVKSINVDGTATRPNIQENIGKFTLTPEYVTSSSSTWLASAIGHDGAHVELFKHGGIENSRGMDAEKKAMGFQREIGMKMGMSGRELGYLETLIADPQALNSYIQTNP